MNNLDDMRTSSAEDLLRSAGTLIRSLYQEKMLLANPLVGSDYRAHEASAFQIAELGVALGHMLVDGRFDRLNPDENDGLAAIAGGALVDGYHAQVTHGLQAQVDLWRLGAWEELHNWGLMDHEDLEKCRRTWPDGNPEFPGYREEMASQEPVTHAEEDVPLGSREAEALRRATSDGLLASAQSYAEVGSAVLTGFLPELKGEDRHRVTAAVGRDLVWECLDLLDRQQAGG